MHKKIKHSFGSRHTSRTRSDPIALLRSEAERDTIRYALSAGARTNRPTRISTAGSSAINKRFVFFSYSFVLNEILILRSRRPCHSEVCTGISGFRCEKSKQEIRSRYQPSYVQGTVWRNLRTILNYRGRPTGRRPVRIDFQSTRDKVRFDDRCRVLEYVIRTWA